MMTIATGTDVTELPQYDPLLGEGQEAELVAYLRRPLPQAGLDSLEEALEANGVNLLEPVHQYPNARELHVAFQKGQPFLWIIAAALAAIGGFVAWWKLSGLVIKPRVGWAAAGAATALVGVFTTFLGVRRRRPLLTYPGLSVTGVGTFLTVREFIPQEKVKAAGEVRLAESVSYNGKPPGTTGIEFELGDKVWCDFRYSHKGKAATVWMGFGIAYRHWPQPGHEDPNNIPAEGWIGKTVSIPEDEDWTSRSVRIEGKVPKLDYYKRRWYETASHFDCLRCVLLAKPPPYANVVAADWDDDVYYNYIW